MKKIIFLLFCYSFYTNILSAQNVGIGITTPHTSALLDLSSTNKGILIPRLTAAQRIAIPLPATGLLVYQTDTDSCFFWYNGNTWVKLLSTKTGWELSGNGATTSSHFIGTTDNQNLLFKRNNIKSGLIDTTNTSFGLSGLSSVATAKYNTAIGAYSLLANQAGDANSAVGYGALTANISGFSNTAIGVNALAANVSAYQNTAVGTSAMATNSTGVLNTAIGVQSLFSNTTGSGNVAGGYNALSANSTGNSNTATGFYSMASNTTGNNNTATGIDALGTNTTGSNNTALGSGALQSNTIGNNNVAIGNAALKNNTTASYSIALGDSALSSQTTSFASIAADIAVGKNALKNSVQSNFNTAVGNYSLTSLIGGQSNTALGSHALYETTSGLGNTAIGAFALGNQGTGNANTAVGHFALNQSTTGEGNTGVGSGAGFIITSGFGNTFIGYGADALSNNLNYASAIGRNAKVGISSAISLGDSSNNTTVGIGTAYPTKAGLVVNQTVGGYVHAMFGSNTTGVAIESNWPGIGFNAYYNGTRKYIATGYAGHINVDQTNGSLLMLINGNGNADANVAFNKGIVFQNGTGAAGFLLPFNDNVYSLGSATRRWTTIYATNNVINTSDERVKKNIFPLLYGLKEVMQLNPVSYQWKDTDAGNQTMLGLLAQDVQKVLPEIIVTDGDRLGMRSTELIPVLTKAIQELETKNKGIEIMNEELRKKLDLLEQQIKSLMEEKK